MKLKYRKSVFILPYAITKKGIEYPLLKRKLHWHGWEFTKGKIEESEKKVDAAKRELKEETGFSPLKGKIKKFNFSGRYLYHKPLPDRPGMKGQTFSLYAAEVKKGKVSLDKREHDGYKWTSFGKALKMLRWPNQKKSLRIVNSWINNG